MGNHSYGPVTYVSGWDEEKYECEWTIKSMREIGKDAVSQNITDILPDKLRLETCRNSPLHSKWTMDVKHVCVEGAISNAFQVICQLDEIFRKETTDIRTTFRIKVRSVDRCLKDVGEIDGRMSMSDRVLISQNIYLNLCNPNYKDSEGTVTFFLTLRLFKPFTASCSAQRLLGTMNQVAKIFQEESQSMCAHILTALMDLESKKFDVTMVCSDGKKLKCHKAVLMRSSPVFKAMMETELSESQTGVIHVKDISGKTMTIIIRYMYTGTLEETWLSSGTIVEFTYAAGKYEIELLLKYVDGFLGLTNNLSFDLHTLCALKDLTGKLSLKNAEANLKEIIGNEIKNSKTHDDIVALFDGEKGEND